MAVKRGKRNAAAPGRSVTPVLVARREPPPPAKPAPAAPAVHVVEEKRAQQGGSPPSSPRSRGRGPRHKNRSLLGRLFYWGLVVGLWLVIAAVGVVAWVGAHLPPIQSLEVPKRPPTVHIAGSNGRVLATRGEMGGSAVPLKELPRHLTQAFIAIEDRRFYAHPGIDVFGIARAVAANAARRGVAQGGSTITQQLAKNLFLTQERTLQRKLQEAVLALWLERRFTKDQILELYLNRTYFGSGAYGVEAAAQRYFGKSARHVNLAEAALLAGLVKSPSRLAPTRNFDGAERRAHVVLAAMADAGLVDEASAKAAIAQPPRIARQTAGNSFNYVADYVMDILDDLVGRVEQDLVVETTIDPALQAAAERAVVEEMAVRGERNGVTQGALVAMTPGGAIRALVGGRNYAESQFNRAVSARRQPGSVFKTYVYLAALERGLSPDTVREDRPIDVKGWRPENYGHDYLGPVTLARAFALSLNTVAVRLALEVGPQSVVRTAHRLGISSKLQPNASIALGTSEVSLLELVSTFTPFANGGVGVVPHVIERVRLSDGGKLLYRARPSSLGRVVDERAVAVMNAMMHEAVLTGTARRADLPGWQAAGKTGTSQDHRDAWFVGYTGQLVAGVWLGNDDNSPTRRMTGGGLPVDIWSRFMRVAHQGPGGTPLAMAGGGMASGAGAGAAPPATVPSVPSPGVRYDIGRPPAPSASGMDGWLMDRLMGRR